MKKFRRFLKTNVRVITTVTFAGVAITGLLLYRLGSLVKGLSWSEYQTTTAVYGWHGMYHQPLYLPLDFLRSIAYFVTTNHSQLVARLPNVLIGAVTILCFSLLIRLWYGNRTAIFATALFASSAYVLHVSRLASYDALYLMIVPTLLLSIVALQRKPDTISFYYLTVLLWGMLIYIPGAIWLVLLAIFWQRKSMKYGWRILHIWWQKLLLVLAGLIWLPLLITDLTKLTNLRLWLGMPQDFAGPLTIARQLADVFGHLLIRGQSNPALWVDRAPIFDIFGLAMIAIGVYFFAANWRNGRARLLTSFLIVSAILVCLGGPVSLGLLVPIAYILAATGIAYLLREWMQVFPFNPIARSLGVGMIVIVVSLSCLYNVRAYFVAWPHNLDTQKTFIHRI